MDWTSEITIDDMPNSDMVLVAESCGLETAIRLLKEMGGIGVYVPSYGLKKFVRRYLAKNKNSDVDVKRLAREFGVTERHIYEILQELKENTNPKQMGLF